jgi:phage-related protein
MTGTNGLWEIRTQVGNNIFRVFCCFDKGNLVILLSGFQKKTQKTPKKEIEKEERLKKEYFDGKTK